MSTVKALAALEKGLTLSEHEFTYDKPLAATDVEIAVEYCGICHSDTNIMNNDWGITSYPSVPGHEAVGKVVAVGEAVTSLKVGQNVGVGWQAGFCSACDQCRDGYQNTCSASQPTAVGRTGGFAQRVRAKAEAAIVIPDALPLATVGPMMCAGATVFFPLVEYNIPSTARVGIVGIGGLGHLALKFYKKWGCEVTAFTSNSATKGDALRALGADHVVGTNSAEELGALAADPARQLDFILVTSNVELDWAALIKALRPRGRLHIVGAVTTPVKVAVFDLLFGAKQLSSSPVASPGVLNKMLEFAARHGIEPDCEEFSAKNQHAEAIQKLMDGKLRFRAVLKMDL